MINKWGGIAVKKSTRYFDEDCWWLLLLIYVGIPVVVYFIW